MNKIVFICILFISSLFANPYKVLSEETQLSIMVNYFFNRQIKEEFPPRPIKEVYVEEENNLNPGQYERYYNYIQRLKAIEETRRESIQKIEEKFRGKASYYNGKLDALKEYYKDKTNRKAFLQEAINQAFKVVYGKPYVSAFRNKKDMVEAKLRATPIYDLENSLDLDLIYDIEILKIHDYKRYPAFVYFNYENEYLEIDSIKIVIDGEAYYGKLKNQNNGKIKLKVKINDDIFQKIKLEDHK